MHSYTRPVNFDQLLLFQNEVHFVPFSTISLQVNLTTCKRFYLNFSPRCSMLYSECLQIIT